MSNDHELYWKAIATGDSRFDGWVFLGVTSTGIYCRPSCPARTPKPENVRFFTTAAAAQAAGFRACKRCRPDATPGSPEWDSRADLVGRAMRLIADGIVDREGVSGLASRLGYTERHIHRQLTSVVGVGALALARAQRAQTARLLLETTDVSIIDVAFAAGFQSVRQFNATVSEIFATTPRQLRARVQRHGAPQSSGAIILRLPYRPPIDAQHLILFLGLRAIPSIEEVTGGTYRRTLSLPHGAGILELHPQRQYIQARYHLEDLRDLAAAVQRSRALLDLDCDPHTIIEALSRDPLLRPLIRAAPGLRLPGHVDGHELAIRAVLGQQVSLSAATTLAHRLTAAHGETLRNPLGTLTHLFPSSESLASADPDTLPMPSTRRRALLGLAHALAHGELHIHPGVDRQQTQRQLLSMPGIGPWTASYIAMRAMRDPDAFLPTDLGVRHALEGLGHDGKPAVAQRLSQNWRPYRSYAMQHLWAQLPISTRPTPAQTAQRRAHQLAA